jgi:hypothetical protein
MEIPYTGRATINDLYNGVEIIVPAKKPAFLIFRILAAIAIAATISFVAVRRPEQSIGPTQQIGGFPIFVYCLMGLSMLFTLYHVWWSLVGKEIVTVTDGVLTITKKGALVKTISYDLQEAKDFRAVKEDEIPDDRDLSKVAYRWGVARQGTIKFDYGIETIQFGDLLSQREGEYILKKLRDKKLIA